MKKILFLAALLALGHKGWTYYQTQNVQPRYAHDYLAVYGRDSCGYTQGTLQALRQAGWTIRYTEWLPAAGAQPAMPRRIEAERGQARVRLIVDRWDLGAAP